MLVATGSIDENNCPILKLRFSGVFPTTGQESEFEAIVDTGFTGFVMMPLMQAFPLGLPLIGTSDVSLADGSSQPLLMALLEVSVGDRKENGVVLLGPPSSGILLGIDFLRKFKLALIMVGNSFALFDEKIFDTCIKQAGSS